MATPKQRQVAKILAENGGKKSLGEAMRDAGYSEVTSKSPTKLTKSKSWQELMDEYLPDAKIAEVHQGLLNAQTLESETFPADLDDGKIKELLNSVGCTPKHVMHQERVTRVWYWAPDASARKSAVELAYKIKGRMKTGIEVDPDQPLPQLVIIRPAQVVQDKQPEAP